MQHQPGILAPLTRAARHLTFDLRPGADPRAGLQRLAVRADGDSVVVGIGASLAAALGATIDGLRPFPAICGTGFDVPATPAALWVWLRHDDHGELVHAAHEITAALGAAFVPTSCVESFVFRGGRDLSGYEDGTENPAGDDALAAAIVNGRSRGFDGSSFVAVQQWRHDFDALAAMSQDARDLAIGRRLADNEEIDEAPESAHVKRTAQESFEPEAFVVRRSMPWSDAAGAGLVFVAFGASLDAFEAQLLRMTGQEDGIADALFSFTRPLTGAYFWCPPVGTTGLDLQALLLP
jgi:putative iron-dependent peroxidase